MAGAVIVARLIMRFIKLSFHRISMVVKYQASMSVSFCCMSKAEGNLSFLKLACMSGAILKQAE